MADQDDDAGVENPVDSLPEDLQAEADALLAEGDQVGPVDADQVAERARSVDLPLAIAEMLNLSFNMVVAPVGGDHWHMSEKECKVLGSAYAAVIEKYWPDFDFGVELVAVVLTVTVVGPRVATGRRIARERAEEKKKAASTGEPALKPELRSVPLTTKSDDD